MVGEVKGEDVRLGGSHWPGCWHHLWGGHEGVCAGVAIVPSSEVAVVRGHNGVLLSLLHILPPPLPNARPTCICQYCASYGGQGFVLSVKGRGGEGRGRGGGVSNVHQRAMAVPTLL